MSDGMLLIFVSLASVVIGMLTVEIGSAYSNYRYNNKVWNRECKIKRWFKKLWRRS